MDNELNQICELVRKCGELIKNANRDELQIDSKAGHANFVTEYDKRVQDMLKAGLKEIAADVKFIGEEGEAQGFSDKGRFFIVDPIDGTTNFIKDYHMSCISVGLIEDGKGSKAVVYNPYLDEMFYAAKGLGAYCNGKRIHVSNQPLENGIVLFGTSPYNAELSEKSFETAYAYFKKALDIRRSGSAALDLCSIAAGRAELYFELILSPWDYAAGALIVEEAGGIVSDMDGNPIVYDRPCPVLARNMD
ncbi:MAG: inositol monophosphatase [Lachnospiraceae bacterium]|nr:inositol monophosphatase [Lachnospiraceae bacterium]